MKKLQKTLVMLIMTVGLLIGNALNTHNSVYAGDREWATVGKILTGLLGASIIHDVITDDHTTTIYYTHPNQYDSYNRYYEQPNQYDRCDRYYYPEHNYHSHHHHRHHSYRMSYSRHHYRPRIRKYCEYYY